MTHTFQQGDRVIGEGLYMTSKANDKEPGTVVEVKHHGVEVMMDRREIGRDGGLWFFCFKELAHDTALRKGDWVRYEGITEFALAEVEGFTGQVMAVNPDSIYVDFTKYAIKGTHWCMENLVKIQPPKEGAMGNIQEDAIERGIQEKIRLLERNLEKAKCCLETYRDLKKFIDQGKGE